MVGNHSPLGAGTPARKIFGYWLTVVAGLVVMGYAWYWHRHPSIDGLQSGLGGMGRVLVTLYREFGSWPVAGFFALVGMLLILVGIWGVTHPREED